MNTNIKTTGITLTPAISDYTKKRLEKVSVFLEKDPSIQCDVELGRISAHHQKGEVFRAEVHLVGSAKNIYVSAEKDDLYSAIDAVKDEVLREIKSDKGKKVSLIRRSGLRIKNIVKGLWPWKDKSPENI